MLVNEVKQIIEDALKDLKKEGRVEFDKLPDVKVEHPQEMQLGDYATNIALVLSKATRNPISTNRSLLKSDFNNIAKLIVEKISEQDLDFIDNVQAVNGFINFFISKEYLTREFLNILKEKEKYGSQETKEGLFGKKKKILIDYSGPNIAKPFGIGHLRSTIIGQAIYNTYKFLGWDCIGVNNLGDWGTPHGAIIYQIKEKRLKGKSEEETEKILESLTVAELERLYVQFNKEAEATTEDGVGNNSEMKEGAKDWFRRLEKGDKEARNIWEHMRAVSLKEFERMYNLLEVDIDNVIGESFYEDMLGDVVKECKDKKITKGSEGALIIDYVKRPKLNFGHDIQSLTLDASLPPAMLIKSDGATTYFTRDLAALKYRLNKFSPSVFVYEVGAEQTLYFKQLFEVARMLDWIKGERLVHVAHGFYRWEHGKFSTRSGHTVHLDEVLEEAVSRAKNIIEESEIARELSESERDEVAKAVGIGAVKYNDLSHNPQGDIVFDWDKILNLKGNSAPYIQYTYARCQSILKKSGSDHLLSTYVRGRTPKGGTTPTSEELDILRFIYRFPEVVIESAEKFSPNLITNFVFDLSQKFNLFYSAHSVLNAENEEIKNFRLLLVASVAQVIHNSLTLLGIKTPDKM